MRTINETVDNLPFAELTETYWSIEKANYESSTTFDILFSQFCLIMLLVLWNTVYLTY